MGDRRLQRLHVGGGGIRLDVGAGEGVGVSGAVDGRDVHALGLEGLGDAGGAGEEVERACGRPRPRQICARTGTRRRFEPRYLITARSWRGHGAAHVAHPTMGCHGVRGPSRCLGPAREALVGRMRRTRTGCAGTSPTTIPSTLSVRLRTVQSMVRDVLDEVPASHPQPIRIVSLCAGQGRDVIDVVATHPRGPEASALLVELDPALVAFARDRAAAAGVADRVRVVEGDASLSRWYADDVPADLVLVCGVFGNISRADITPPSRRCGGSAGPAATSSGPGTAARPTPRPPSGPSSRPPGSPRSPSRPPRGP